LEDAADAKSSITLQVIGSEGTNRDSYSNVTVTKAVRGIGDKLEFKYSIKTPKVDDFDFVLALDSSGSMGVVGEPEQGKAVAFAVPEFIKNTIELNSDKNFKMSIISWDDNIDFAYGNDFNNTVPKNAKLVPIKKAEEDIKILESSAKPVFGEDVGKDYYYKSGSREHTNISKAIEASIDVFSNNPPNYWNRTSRFVILVVGESEYDPCNENLIKKAEEGGYPIYVIGMPFNEKNDMLDHLSRDICYNNSSKLRLQTTSSPTNELKGALLNALNQALLNATCEPVAQDVRFVESFYRYLPLGEKVSAKTVGKQDTDIENIAISKDNLTGISRIEFQLPFDLDPDTTTELTLYSGLELSVPLPTIGNITAQPSKISYKWLRNKLQREIALPYTEFGLESTSLGTG
jgi:hypothetical protein